MLRFPLVLTLLATLLPPASAVAATTDGLCPAGYQPPQRASATLPTASALSPEAEAALPSPKTPDWSRIERLKGEWRSLPRSPFGATHAVATWAGTKMVAVDPDGRRTATYFPQTRRWEEHQPVPASFDPESPTVWTGEDVIVIDRAEETSVAYAFDPARGRWREIAPPPITVPSEAVWTGNLVIAASDDRAAAAYDPATDCWLNLPEMPLPEPLEAVEATPLAGYWQVRSLHWTGQQVLVLVGADLPLVTLGVVAFDPSAWTWDPGTLGPLHPDAERGLFALGRLWFIDPDTKTEPYVSNATYDPGSERWQIIDTGCPLSTFEAVWTGRLIMQPFPEARAYDPMTGECFRLPDTRDRERTSEAIVWTGREVIRWSGEVDDTGRARPDGIVYRPPRSAITAEKAEPVDKKLARAIRARRRFGFDTDPAVVREIVRDPHCRKLGIPMSRDECRDLNDRIRFSVQFHRDVDDYVRSRRIHGGTWIDQRAGGTFVIALTEADPRIIARIDELVPKEPDLGWRLVIVPTTRKELNRAFDRARKVSRDVDPTAMLWSIGRDDKNRRIRLMYDPDDVERMRARKKELEKKLGFPVLITSGRVRDL